MIIVETFQRGGAACRETLLPSLHRCLPAAAKIAYYAIDHAKIASSTAAAATNSRPRSPIRHRLPRPAQPLRKTPPRQILIVGQGSLNPAPCGFPPRFSDAGPLTPGPPLTRTGSETLHRPGSSHRLPLTSGLRPIRPFGCLRVKESSRPEPDPQPPRR